MNQQLPPRKRRRPALSCIECRRRKIKCDRNMPCNHCTQNKSAVCSYKNTHSIAPMAPPNPPPTNEESKARFFDPLPQNLSALDNISESDRQSWFTTSGGNTDGSPSEKSAPSGRLDRTMGEMSLYQQPPSAGRGHDETMSVLGINLSTPEDVIFQDGNNRNVLRTKAIKNSDLNPMHDTKDSVCKTRFFGQSHWMFAIKQLPQMCRLKELMGNPMNGEATKDVRETLEKCKRLARAAKAERPMEWHINPNFKDYIPQRELADKLVHHYLRTCESVYRILHVPSFKRDYAGYWQDPEGASTTLTITILLVMAIGTCIHQEEGNEELRSMAHEWVCAVQSWNATFFAKSRLNVAGIQIHCLLLLARQITNVGGDLIWTESGTLLRIAFMMGFHRDPKHFPNVPPFIGEMRRRIWATVLEMALQTALESGMPPLLTSSDFDTEPPANIADEDISNRMTVIPSPKPAQVFTQTSIQIMLVKSQRTRLRVVQDLNSFNSNPSYDEILRIDKEITVACNDASRLVKSYPASLPRPTALQRNLLDIFVRRYLLQIHLPFSLQSRVDPRHYYSRKVCLETALTIFFHKGDEDLPPGHDPRIVDDYSRMKIVWGGFYKAIIFHAAMIVTVELIIQLEDDIASGLPPFIQRKAAREPMYQVVQDIVTLAAQRIQQGENNVKTHLFPSAAAAQIHAMTHGMPPEEVVPQAAKRSTLQCLELLRARTKAPPATPVSEPANSVDGGIEGLDELDYGFNELIPDANMDFDIPDSWVFTGWDMN